MEKKLPENNEKKVEKQSNRPRKFILTEDVLNDIINQASEVAAREMARSIAELQGRLKDKRLHNTKLLLKKYRGLSDYATNAIYSTAQLCSDGTDEVLKIMGVDLGERYEVDSIRNSVIITRMIMEHIDAMLDTYKERCEKSSRQEVRRRWRELDSLYLSDEAKTVQEIADQEHVSVSMVYQDLDICCEDLSSLFFGLDLSEFWKG